MMSHDLRLAKLRYSVPESIAALGISRALFYVRVRAGEIKVQHDGKRTFVTAAELKAYVDRCQALAQAA